MDNGAYHPDRAKDNEEASAAIRVLFEEVVYLGSRVKLGS